MEQKVKIKYAKITGKIYYPFQGFDELYEKIIKNEIQVLIYTGNSVEFTKEFIKKIYEFHEKLIEQNKLCFFSVLPYEQCNDYMNDVIGRADLVNKKSGQISFLNRIVGSTIKADMLLPIDISFKDLQKKLNNLKDLFIFMGHSRAELAWINDGIIGGIDLLGNEFYQKDLNVLPITEINAKNIFFIGCFSNKICQNLLQSPMNLAESALKGGVLTFLGMNYYTYNPEILAYYYAALFRENIGIAFAAYLVATAAGIIQNNQKEEMFLLGDPREREDVTKIEPTTNWNFREPCKIEMEVKTPTNVIRIFVEDNAQVINFQKNKTLFISGFTTTQQDVMGVFIKLGGKYYFDIFSSEKFKCGKIILKTKVLYTNEYKRLNNILDTIKAGIISDKSLEDDIYNLLRELRNARNKSKHIINFLSDNRRQYKKIELRVQKIRQIENKYNGLLYHRVFHNKVNIEEEAFENLDYVIKEQDTDCLCPYCENKISRRMIFDSFDEKIKRQQKNCPQCGIIYDGPAEAINKEPIIEFNLATFIKTGTTIKGKLKIQNAKEYLDNIEKYIYVLRGEENLIVIKETDSYEDDKGALIINFIVSVNPAATKYIYFLKALVLIMNKVYVVKKDIVVI